MKKDTKAKIIALSILVLQLLAVHASANNIESSQIGNGVKNMVSDISTFLVVLSPIIGAAAAGFFLIRRAMADEQDGKTWMKRVWIAVGCGAGGFLVSGLIALISSYF